MLLQLARYGVVGLANNAVGYIFYLFITHIGVEPKLAMTVVYAIGLTISYICNRKWVFPHRAPVTASLLRYVVAHLFGYLINLSMLIIFSSMMDFPHQLVQASAIFVVAAFLFVSFRIFVVPNSKQDGIPA
jgi:putative flippase GtrA